MAIDHPTPISDQPAPPDPRRLRAANRAAVAFYREQLGGEHARGVRDYLRIRGLGTLARHDSDEGPARWLVGYAPRAWTALTHQLRAEGFTGQELVAAGLSVRTRNQRLIDRFRDRLMFPIRDPAGHPLGFIGRAAPAAGPAVPKYLNTPETALYRKGTVLFGVAEQQDRIQAGWRPVVVEGPIDAIAVRLSHTSHGRSGAIGVASCGTTLTHAQATILCNMPGAGNGIVVAYDDDPAGHTATERAWSVLRNAVPPGPLLAAALAGGDPADLLRSDGGRAAVRNAVQGQAYPLVQAVIDHRLTKLTTRHPRLFEDIAGRCAAVRAVVPLLFDAVNAAQATELATRVTERLGVGLDTVAIAMAEHVDGSLHDAGTALEQAALGRPPPVRSIHRSPSAAILAFPTLRMVGTTHRTDALATTGERPVGRRDSIGRTQGSC
ncbi:toprim domain-containing protein [Micromonospora sp. NPDC049900]|uniref:toprim domain-containing protein n=1 Tax=Micromonospora sp. NPDC049900 TaxID=3364275 RepID=UPI0037AFD05C